MILIFIMAIHDALVARDINPLSIIQSPFSLHQRRPSNNLTNSKQKCLLHLQILQPETTIHHIVPLNSTSIPDAAKSGKLEIAAVQSPRCGISSNRRPAARRKIGIMKPRTAAGARQCIAGLKQRNPSWKPRAHCGHYSRCCRSSAQPRR